MSTTGKYLQAQANGGNLCKGMTEWSSEDTGDSLDEMDAESLGYTDAGAGAVGVRIRVRVIWDLADGPFPDIRRGVTLTNAKFYANRTQTTPDYDLPLALVDRMGKTVQVRDRVMADFDVVNKGLFRIGGVAAATGT